MTWENAPPSSEDPAERRAYLQDAHPAADLVDVAKTREEARVGLAWAIFGLLVLTLIGGPVLAMTHPVVWGQFRTYYGEALSAEFTLLASVAGYYYGSRRT